LPRRGAGWPEIGSGETGFAVWARTGVATRRTAEGANKPRQLVLPDACPDLAEDLEQLLLALVRPFLSFW